MINPLQQHFQAADGHNSDPLKPVLGVTDINQLKELADRHEIAPLTYIKLLESIAFSQQEELRIAHKRIEELGGELAATSDALTAEKESRAAAEIAKRIDPLTGLLNRGAFNERLAALLDEDNDNVAGNDNHNDVCIVYIDIDGLKQTNDNYGHATGDRLLLAATKLFQERLRDMDEIFRVGGDEVTFLMRGKPETIVKRILRMQLELERMHVRANVAGEWKNIPVWGFSFGIHQVDKNKSVEDNYKAADAEMYKDKEQRKANQAELRTSRLAAMIDDKTLEKSYNAWVKANPVNANEQQSAPQPTQEP